MGLPVVSHSAIGQVEMRTLALIPARAGSKGIPGKNWKPFAGGGSLAARAWFIGTFVCDSAYVSTDKDKDEAFAAPPWTMPCIQRPPELAQDDTPMLPVVQHALRTIKSEHDVIVLLQPTQPLRKLEHIK